MSDQKSPDNHSPYQQRRKRAEEFEVHIPEEELTDIGGGEHRGGYSGSKKLDSNGDSISSYSAPPPPQGNQNKTPEERKKEQREEKEHCRRNKMKGKKNRRIFKLVWIVMVVFAGLSLAQFLLSGVNDMLAVERSKLTVTIEIPKDATTEQVSEILYDNGVIERVDFFKLYSKVTKADGNFRRGTYKLDTNMDYEAIINHLQSNAYRVDTVKVTFREGLNVMEIAKLIEDNGICDAEDILELANSTSFDGFDLIKAIPNSAERYYKLEGYLFPDTYEFYKGEDPQDAISKLLRNGDKKLDEDLLEQIKGTEKTVDEIMTLASIIEEESADEEDMYTVSSVLWNRLENGAENGTAQLGCDSTSFYPYRTKAQVPTNLKDTFQSRYDTYKLIGLPPGPICNPSMKAIDAAIYPTNTDYYYFCHDKEGKAYYAKTAKQHEANLKKAGLKE